MSWELRINKSIWKRLKKFPRKDNERIQTVLCTLATDPYQGDIEKMQGERNSWRRRIGSYRISYEISVGEKVIRVFRIERRTSKSY